MRILILGGTAEARELADRLAALGHEVINSLAGRTSDPKRPTGSLRVGKFGGIPGLTAYLRAHRIDRMIDATHPYAGLISINAVAAAGHAAVPLVRFARPPWPQPAGVEWINLVDAEHAAAALPVGARALVTVGSGELPPFLRRRDCTIFARMIERPAADPPRHVQYLISRPPYTVEGEIRLMREHGITHLVTKNSGSDQTVAKLRAAEALGIFIIMLVRPLLPRAIEAATIEDTITALDLPRAIR